ncbi:hypothetical protein GCM10025878_00660 [Leuconostoc gasicomitatum]|uniref:Omega-3 polyunsaturated fatty acid synthase subunit, PfaA n=1 Tax=Leuconostoc inhae TaxID=178001 RepID=A0ABM9V0F0_9LACO|nr:MULTISPECIES: SDR family NAD(P)-dependent oxidoreductase [Leuconostoc]GMA04995.1 hypothetical protein GCM10025878_00660 [Leuconostoc gasicomitatum]CUW06474.1 omega-3 polyunsaturated fatty acid synthase subunit, PfaA [Leuconostoc inhae]
MEKEIALERIQLLEDNGIYLKRNISGKKAVIFPGHGSQYVNMLSDLKGKHKIVDEVLKESEDYYKEIAGMPFWERLKTDEINTIPTLMQPAIIIANEVYFRILKKKYGVCPNVLLGHSLGEISALCAASVISFKDAIKIAYQRAKCLEFLDEKSKGRMISLKLSSNEEEKAINNYLFLHDNLELAIVNSQTQKIISGTKEDIKQLEKYCESIEIVSYILPVPYPFHSALLESIKGKYQQEIKKISFTIPSINIYSTILSRLYLKKDFVNIVEILGNQLIEPFNFKSIIEDLYNNYNVKKFFECGSNRIMTNIVDEILKGKEYTCINLNSKKENDFVTLKKAEVKLSMIDNQDSNHSLYAIINSVTGYPIDIIKKSIETNDFQSNYGLQLALSSETQEQIIEKYNRKSQSQYTSFDALILNKVPEYENSSSKKNDELLIKLGNAEQISDKVKGYISEKTGYPLELLEDDADLEADLGIDSVKQAEILAKVKDEFTISDSEFDNSENPRTISQIVALIKTADSLADVENATSVKEENAEQISDKVKGYISEKTGYPLELLEDDADLEADLGIDSVKQAEILAKVKDEFTISDSEFDNSENPRTISQIVALVAKKSITNTEIQADENVIIQPDEFYDMNRYTSKTINFSQKHEMQYLLEDKSILIISESKKGVIGKLLSEKLSEKNKVTTISPLEVDFENTKELKRIIEYNITLLGKVDCIINLQGITEFSSINDFENMHEWENRTLNIYNGLFYTSKISYDFLSNNSNTAYFGATNIGDYFGLENKNHETINPLGGLVTGFIKALEKELRPFISKVVDINESDNLTDEQVANILLKEFSTYGKLIEIGIKNNVRKGVITSKVQDDVSTTSFKLSNEEVILVTGGGRGITYECAKKLAISTGTKLILTGRTELPSKNNPYIQMSEIEFEKYKKEFMVERKRIDPNLSVIEIVFEYEKLKNARVLFNNLKILTDLKIQFDYIKCDFSKEKYVVELKQHLDDKNIRISGIINGAGLPSFGKINAKNELLAQNVVKVKSNSIFMLFKYFITQSQIKFIIHMGSISGRFGMDGQVDYSAAADLLVKISNNINSLTNTKSIVIGWPAWDEVGMAMNDDVEKVQKYERGLSFISVSEGTQRFLEEIFLYQNLNEVLIFNHLGEKNMPLGQLDDVQPDQSKKNIINDDNIVIDREKYSMIEKVEYFDKNKITATRKLSITTDRHLQEHIVNGTNVLAGVFHIEAAAELADLYLNLNEQNGFRITKIRDFNFMRFIKVYPTRTVDLKITGNIIFQNEDKLIIKMIITSDFKNIDGVVLQNDIVNSSGIIEMEKNSIPITPANFETDLIEINNIDMEKSLDIYKYYDKGKENIFFGPEFQNINNVRTDSNKNITGANIIVTDESGVFTFLKNINSQINPILIDNFGRLMLLNEFHQNGSTVVPTHISETVKYGNFKIGEQLKVYVKKIGEENNEVIYDGYIYRDKELLLSIKKMHLTKVGQVSDYDIAL